MGQGLVFRGSLFTLSIFALAACSGQKSSPTSSASRQISSTESLTDEEFKAVAGDFGLSPQQVATLKKEYDENGSDQAVNNHSQYLRCKQAGDNQARDLKLFEQCDREGERGAFVDLGRRIQLVQEKNRQLHANPQRDGKSIFRGFHAKAHGCLYGKLTVNDPSSRPAWTRAGVFARQSEYLTWTRFSNGTGLIQGDYKTEPRGMAIKLLDVDGPRASLFGHTFEGHTQDFLMTNKAFATTPDPTTFIEFAEATSGGKLATLNFIRKNLWIFPILKDLKFNKSWLPNMATIQYWSGVPISMGKNSAGQMVPVKFFVQACKDAKYLEDEEVIADIGRLERLANKLGFKDFSNYGRNYLKKLAAKYDVCYDLKFQIQTDVSKTSVEDGLDEWTVEESEPVTVAQLVMPKQNFDTDEQNRLCERMRMNPWNAIEEHTPMSDTNQARGIVYLASAKHREKKDWTHAGQTIEPKAADHPLNHAR